MEIDIPPLAVRMTAAVYGVIETIAATIESKSCPD